MKVLMIDGSARSVSAVREHLAAEELDLISAADGETGIQAARREQPDLILLDLNLPGMSGFETCRALKEDSSLSMIPAIRSEPNILIRSSAIER